MMLRYLFVVLCLIFALPAQAVLDIEISGAGENLIPISIVPFAGEEKLPHKISEIIANDLYRSGLFRLVDPAGKTPHDTKDVVYSQWSAVDGLAIGSVALQADGKVSVQFRFLDSHKQVQLLGWSSTKDISYLRAIAHKISDDIYEKLTGTPGVFSTRIGYINRQGKANRLVIADSDGYGEQIVLSLKEPVLSISWSPDGTQLAYVTLEKGHAVIFTQVLANGKRTILAEFPGTNSSPTWSPDGKQLAVVLTKDGTSALYLIRPDGTGLRRITYGDAIDTEPSFSPDGRFLLFVSDRGGSAQIYRMPVEGGYAERMTFEGSSNFSPRYSPDGKNFVFTHFMGGQLYIATQDFQTKQMQVLTDVGWEKKPSYAPNGKLVLFATESLGRGILTTVSSDGKLKLKMTPQQGDIREPMWGPFLK